jgi:hypothetical protein
LAARELVEAVRELLPERFAELQEFARSFLDEAEMSTSGSGEDGDPFLEYREPYGEVYEGLCARAHEWTVKNKISSSAVDGGAVR